MMEIRIDTDINEWAKDRLLYSLEEAKRRGEAITVRANSPGGSILSAYDMFQAIRNYPYSTECVIEGVAASAMSFIALAFQKVYIVDFGLIMWHNTNGLDSYEGLTEKERNAMEAFNNSIATIISKRTGKTLEEVRELMQKETWFDASQALNDGLVDEIIETEVRKPDLSNLTLTEVFNSITKITNQRNMNIKEIANALNCPEDKALETVRDMQNQLQTLKSEKSTLEAQIDAANAKTEEVTNQLEDYRKAEQERRTTDIKNRVAAAQKDGRIPATDTAKWEERLTNNFDTCAQILDELPKRSKLSEQVSNGIDPEKKPEKSAWELEVERVENQFAPKY